MNPQITYKVEDDILLVWFSEGDIYDAEMVGSTILHVNKQGEPVLLEVLDASDFVDRLTETVAAAKAEHARRSAA